MANIVYEDADLVAIYQPGVSDYLLITFSGLDRLAGESDFFARTPATKAGIACLGFTAKATGRWYPRAAMARAIAAVEATIKDYVVRITYGGSMGGYAAIKYASALRATGAIALCPQWTIDHEECDGFDPGYQQYFTPKLRGMSIRSDDVSGNVVVIFDPFEPLDRFHAARIAALSPLVTTLTMPMVGHRVTHALAGTENLVSMIGAVRRHDLAAIHRLIRRNRRYYHHRFEKLLDYARTRLPNLLNRHVCDLLEQGRLPANQIAGYVHRATAHCAAVGDLDRAMRIFENHVANTRFEDQWKFLIFLSDLFKADIKILTDHETSIYFDLDLRKFVNTFSANDMQKEVRISVFGLNKARFHYTLGTETFYAGVRDGLLFSTSDIRRAAEFEMSKEDDGFTLKTAAKFVCAGPPVSSIGTFSADRDKAGKWERFAFCIATTKEHSLTKRASASTFHRKVV